MIGELDETKSVESERALWPELTEVHQKLHNIVAEAAWLANGISFSRSCFWVEFSQPGQLWDIRQDHAIDTNWTESSQAAADLFESTEAMRTWYDNRNAAFQKSGQPDKALEQWTRNVYLPRNPKPRDPVRRTAKVQISMWPFLERYFPHRQNTANGGDTNSGDFTNTVQKAQVVYYAGEDSDAGEQLEEYTLSQHLSDWEKRNTNSVARLFKAAFALFPTRLLAALLWACFALLTLSIAGTTFQHGVNRLIHGQDSWLGNHGRNVLGYNVSGPIIDSIYRQDRFSRPGSLRDDNSAPQNDAPVPKHPLREEDPKTTGTTVGQAASNASEHKTGVVTEIIPYDPSFPANEPPTKPPSAHDRQPGTEALVVPITDDVLDKLSQHTAQPEAVPEALPETSDSSITSELPGQPTGKQGLRDESSLSNPPHISTVESTLTYDSKASERTTSGKMIISNSDGKESKTSRDVTGDKEEVKGKTSKKGISGNGSASSQTSVSLDSSSTSKTSTSAQSSSSGADGNEGVKGKGSANVKEATKSGVRNRSWWDRIGDSFKSLTSKTSPPDESTLSETKVEQSGKASTSGNIRVSEKGKSSQKAKSSGGTTEVVTQDVTTKTASQDITSLGAAASSATKLKAGMIIIDPSKKPQPSVDLSIDKYSQDDSGKVVDDEKALPGKWVTTQVFGIPYNCWVSAGEATCTQTVAPGSTDTGERAEFTAAGDTILVAQDL